LPHPIPDRVNDRDIHRLLAKIGQEIAQAEQGFARADRVRARSADMSKRLGLRLLISTQNMSKSAIALTIFT
jgi:hypothetical protein